MNRDRNLLTSINKRKTAYLRHILRHSRYSLLKLILEGKIEDQRGPGRRKFSWLKNIRDWTELDSHLLLKAAADSEVFAVIVANLH